MPSFSGPPVGGFASTTSSASSPPIDIPQTSGCNRGCTCGCGCMFCPCRSQVSSADSNQQEYGGEGTHSRRLGVGAPSYVSTNSLNSVKESSDAPDPTATKLVAPPSYDMIRSVHDRHDPASIAQTKMARFLDELDDECPWPFFLEKSITSDATDDDHALFRPIEVEGSMHNNAPVSSAEQSMLSSFLSSLSPRTPSVGVSEVIRGVGGISGPRGGVEPGHRYLRLN